MAPYGSFTEEVVLAWSAFRKIGSHKSDNIKHKIYKPETSNDKKQKFYECLNKCARPTENGVMTGDICHKAFNTGFDLRRHAVSQHREHWNGGAVQNATATGIMLH